MMSSIRQGALGLVIAAAVLAPAAPAQAGEVAFGPNDIQTTFFISKSDDKNRVDYGMRLDANCAPVNDDSVFPYWREFEKSPPVRTHGLSFVEHVPYGISDQKIVKKTTSGGEYSVRLKQLNRTILISTKRDSNGRCSALSRAQINGVQAQLLNVFAKLAGLMSVDYIDVIGKNLETGAAMTERIKK